MPREKAKSAAEVARDSVIKLRHYLDKTSITDVPKNQFKKSSRQRICKELGITYSTVGSNTDLAELFEQLDKKLGSDKTQVKRPNSHEVHQLQVRINILENRVASLKAEKETLLSRLKRCEHFENTGRMARP